MDIDFNRLALRCLRDFSERASAVRARLARIPNRLTPLKGIAWLLVALALGFQAYEQTRREATAEWERTHPPSPDYWTYVLRDWEPVRAEADLQRVLRFLPVSFEHTPETWITPSGDWIVIMNGHPNEVPHVFRRGHKPSTPRDPGQWQRLGGGWTGLSAIQVRLKVALARPRSPTRAFPIDNRAIHY